LGNCNELRLGTFTQHRVWIKLSWPDPGIWAAFCLAALFISSVATADTTETVRFRLAQSGWGNEAINSLLSIHAEEFSLDARSGWLNSRLDRLAGLGRHRSILRIIEQFPEYADLFVNAAKPEMLARTLSDLAIDSRDMGRLLNLFIGWSSRAEIEHLQQVLESHGASIMFFADSAELYLVAEALALSHTEGAPLAYLDWLAIELRRHRSEHRLEEILVVNETHGRVIAGRMADPNFAIEFPFLWRQFRGLLNGTTYDREHFFSGLLSHAGVWDTLSQPNGAAALQHSKEWASLLLFTLWGSAGWTQPAEAAGPLLEFRDMLRPETREWLLRTNASSDDATRALGKWGLLLYDSDDFWEMTLDSKRSPYLSCILADAERQSGWNGSGEMASVFRDRLKQLANLEDTAVTRMCRPSDSMFMRALPGYFAVTLIGDLWAGVPITALDVVSTGSDLYGPGRYALLLGRGVRFATVEGLRLGARMPLDHLLTQRAITSSGQVAAISPRPLGGIARNYVILQTGLLAPVPREMLRESGLFFTKETLQNLAVDGLMTAEATQRVVVHFKCAGQNLHGSEDPRCN